MAQGGVHLPALGRAARGPESWINGMADLGLDSTLAGLGPSAPSSGDEPWP